MRVAILLTPKLLAQFGQLPVGEQMRIRAGVKVLRDPAQLLKLKSLVPPGPPWFTGEAVGYRWQGFMLTDEQAALNGVTSPALMIAEIVRGDELRTLGTELLEQARADFEASGDDE
jgi:hypothetical protein